MASAVHPQHPGEYPALGKDLDPSAGAGKDQPGTGKIRHTAPGKPGCGRPGIPAGYPVWVRDPFLPDGKVPAYLPVLRREVRGQGRWNGSICFQKAAAAVTG